MKPLVMIILLSGLISGCTTARLSTGPDVYALSERDQGIKVGVMQTVDDRKSTTLGTVGGAGFSAKKEDLSNQVTNYMIHTLHSKLGANILRVKQVSATEIYELAKENKLDYVIVSKIQRMKLFSFDALMQPVKVEMDLKIEVYDKAGSLIYDEVLNGLYEKRMWPITDKGAGKLVESTVQDAMSRLAQDSYLQKSLRTISKS